MLKYMLPLSLALLCVSPMAEAKPYAVDAAKSEIAFNVTHAGRAVKGVFEKWTADIDFDAKDLKASKISAVIETASAKTGDPMYDGTLPGGDWLDVKKFPTAQFTATQIEKTDKGYVAHGELTLKGKTQKLDLPFTLTPQDGDAPHVSAAATAQMDRIELGVGVGSDPKSQWVGKEIGIVIALTAKAE